jgi:hypothetical protein
MRRNRSDNRDHLTRSASDAKLSIEKRPEQVWIFNDFHYFARVDAYCVGISGSTGGIHSLFPVVAFAGTIRARPSSPCDRTTKRAPSLIINSNLQPADTVPALPAPPFAAATRL